MKYLIFRLISERYPLSISDRYSLIRKCTNPHYGWKLCICAAGLCGSDTVGSWWRRLGCLYRVSGRQAPRYHQWPSPSPLKPPPFTHGSLEYRGQRSSRGVRVRVGPQIAPHQLLCFLDRRLECINVSQSGQMYGNVNVNNVLNRLDVRCGLV